MKKSITLLEILFVLLILSIIYSIAIPKKIDSKLQKATEYLLVYLNYTRYLALIDNKYDPSDNLWFRKMYRLRFENCTSNIGGLYFIVFSDENKSGQAKKEDSIKDPLTFTHLYSRYNCDPKVDESKYVLLTKEFGVTKIDVSCNTTSSIGQILFGNDGRIYSKVGTQPSDFGKFEIKEQCFIHLYDKNRNKSTIIIEPHTGLSYQQNYK
ncbi:pilus assembly FimT family protein [Arcobacter sp. FWKO B]|uniref:pilus assembly FimT family protein n=1 Tax=Arcobacter sp. FWKO B TaxID=2593672 RepID=UPI0018A500B6|nr:type II secretion system protein [Arcobacter sp. FWKO B]QOG12057.1 type II secretion system protein [Arcobacter sp. FWKO B]